MNKNLKFFMLGILIGLAFKCGTMYGEQSVINKQIVYNDNKTVGEYFVEYDGNLYSYWYE